MKKNFLCIIMIFAMLSAYLTAYSAEEESYDYEAAVLEQLGIAESEIFYEPTKPIKRTDFAVLVAGLRGFDGTSTAENVFVDVDSEHYAAGSIAYLKSLEVLSGYEDLTFRGENTITYAEAAKVLTTLMGYEKHAQAEGGWKTGYLRIASDLGLSKGMGVASDAEITQRQAIKMVYNALETSICTVKYSDRDTELVTEKENTPMSVWLNLVKTEGLVKTVGELAVTRDSAVKNKLTVGDLKLDTNGKDYADYLGKYCEVYYFNDKSDNSGEIAAIVVLDKKNDITVINSDDIISFVDGVLSYYEGSVSRRISIGKNDEISLNGDPVAADDRETTVLNFDGIITVNELSKGDIGLVAMISSFETIVVNTIDEDKLTIYGKYSKKIEMDDDALITVLDEEGRETDFSDIAPDDVLTIKKNASGTKFDIQISQEIIDGEFNGSYTEDGRTYNKIGSTEYKLTKDYEKNASIIERGSKVSAYLDEFGRIAYISTETSAYTYGFLYRVTENEDEDLFKAEIFTLNGEFVKYNLDEKIKIDGERPDSDERLMTYLKRGNEGYSYYQLMRFTVNARGNINKIDTAYQSLYEPSDSLRMIFKGCDKKGDATQKLVYKPRGYTFQNLVLYNTSVTKAMTVPKTYTSSGDKEYFIIGKSMTEDDQVAFNAYVSSEDQLCPDVILFYTANNKSSAGELISDTYKGLVTNVEIGLNGDDEQVYNVTVDCGTNGVKNYVSHPEFDGEDVVKFSTAVSAANAYKAYVNGTTDIADRGLSVAVGDYVEVSEDAIGRLRFVRKLVDGVTGECYMDTADSGGVYGDRYVYGMVYKLDGSNFAVSAQKDFAKITDSSLRYYIFNNTSLYRVKTGKKAKVEQITQSDLRDYKSAGERADKVMIFSSYGKPFTVIAYE